jgi:hypothetical protein
MSTLNPIWFYCAVSEAQYLKAEARVRRTGKQISELAGHADSHGWLGASGQGQICLHRPRGGRKDRHLAGARRVCEREKLLRPGCSAASRWTWRAARQPLVPERAVAELQGKNFVWVIGPDNKATQRPVKVGDTLGENVLILEG